MPIERQLVTLIFCNFGWLDFYAKCSYAKKTTKAVLSASRLSTKAGIDIKRSRPSSMDPLELDRLNAQAKSELSRLIQQLDLNFNIDREWIIRTLPICP